MSERLNYAHISFRYLNGSVINKIENETEGIQKIEYLCTFYLVYNLVPLT